MQCDLETPTDVSVTMKSGIRLMTWGQGEQGKQLSGGTRVFGLLHTDGFVVVSR